jgi:hypothetical protein
MKSKKTDLRPSGRVQVPDELINDLHLIRARQAEPGKKLFLKDLVTKILQAYINKHK